MIKIFRSIRQKLISKNKISRYLLYAMGEILLVVIGILIALQINNWNTQRLRTQDEIKALMDLLEGFKSDTMDVIINIDASQKATVSGNIILKILNSNSACHDSLHIHFTQSLLFTRLISQDGP